MGTLGLMLLGACSSDYLPTSGGKLKGTLSAAPVDWTQIAAVDIVQLETRPTDPYSVNLWVIGAGSNLYVFAGANRANWIEHLEANPAARLRIGEAIFDLIAERVTDATEFKQFADAWEAKYGNRPRNENVTEAYLMRLYPNPNT